MKLERTAVLTLAIFYGASSMAIEPPREGQQAFLSRAVFVDGRVWLLSDAGELSSIGEKDDKRIDESLPEPALDICVHEGKLLAVTCKRGGCDQWNLRRREHGTWSVDASFPVKNERGLALACENSTVTLLTTGRLVDVDGSKLHEVHLSQELDSALVAAVHDTPEGVFVGLNAGEWGGGLRRIDRGTGKVTEIMSNPSGELCGGPLNTQCDPVNGIVTEPWNHQCVAAAIGLMHMAPHGRIVEICGTTVRRLYFKEYVLEGFGFSKPAKDDEPFSTTAFFGLSTQGNSLWATGIDGIYEIGADGVAQITPMPKFKEIGGIYVNFDLPHVILVLTQVNQRRSLSDAVPLLVPRVP